MKGIRIFFRFGYDEFCVDRPYIDTKSDTDNCKDAMDLFVEGMKSRAVIPALKLLDREKNTAERVFLNLSLMPVVTIGDVIVYVPEAANDE